MSRKSTIPKEEQYYDHHKIDENYGSGYHISQLEREKRPREKAADTPESVKGLTASELIAIIIRTGTPQANAVDLATHILAEHEGSLLELYKTLINDSLYNLKGFGTVKRVSVLAALELGLRIHEELTTPQEKTTPIFDNSEQAYRFMKKRLIGMREEQMWVLILNSQFGLIKPFLVTKGGITETIADVRTILRHVIRFSGTGFILVHNHPGGSTQPSGNDRDLTRQLLDASRTLFVTFLDHLIFTDHGYYSFRDECDILN